MSAAVLVKLKPEFAQNTPFVSFVDTLIRDTANPSVQERLSLRGVCPFSRNFVLGIGPKKHPTYVRIFNRCDVLVDLNAFVVGRAVTLFWVMSRGPFLL